MAKKAYRVLSPVDHNQKRYEEGSKMTLDDNEAAPLLQVKAIESFEGKPEIEPEIVPESAGAGH